MNATFEPGLPGTGQQPTHLDSGHPTPWSEGVVVRVEPDGGPAWLANAQPGYGFASKVVPWEGARAIILIASGAAYFIRPDAPDSWSFICIDALDCTLTPSQEVAILATHSDLIALSIDGRELWRRSIGVDGVEICHVTDDHVEGRACLDPPDRWLPYRVLLHSGADG
jgi:hypothetical protein